MHLNLTSSESEGINVDDDESDSHSTSSKLCEYLYYILKNEKSPSVYQLIFYKIISFCIYLFVLKYQETMFISLVKGKRRLAAQFNQPIEPQTEKYAKKERR